MSTEVLDIRVSDLAIQVVRKNIKNMHLGVYPPNGRVRIAVPLGVSNAAVRTAVVGKLGWINKQRAKFAAQPRQSAREMVSGESHYYLGRRYRLRVVKQDGPSRVVQRGHVILELMVRRQHGAKQRHQVLLRWYRQRLRELLPPLFARWEERLGVRASGVGIKAMRTKWGSCNVNTRRIWLNLELAKKPLKCLEYLIVHELTHLIERRHNERFVALLDQHMPRWRFHKKVLNEFPLAHVDWTY